MARSSTQLTSDAVWSPSPIVRIHVQALGACQLQIGSERLSPASDTLFGIVVRLVYAPHMQLTRDVLMSAFWPGQPESRQRGNLRQALYKLRRMNVLMEHDGDLVRLDARQVAHTFAIERTIENFERDVLQEHEPFGVFLPGYEPRSAELHEWLRGCREVVHSDVRRVLVDILRSRRERADWRSAEAISRWVLQFDPLNEEGTLTLAECTALNGGKAQAIEMLDRYLEDLGADAGAVRIPAATLRRRIVDPGPRRVSFAPTERHFVGRQEEVAELTLALRRSRWHDGSAYLIHGPPGMGKTRLTLEMSKVAAIEGVLQLRFSCRESDSTRPLSLALELVTDVLSAPGAIGCAPESLRHLRRLVGEEPMMLADDGTPLPREPLPSPAAIRRAIADVVAAVSEEKPIFLVVDDVHWLDRQSWDVLLDLIERTESMRLCMMLTSRQPHACVKRPERVPEGLKVRELRRLSEEEAVSLIAQLASDLTAQPTTEELQSIVRQSERIPLMLRAIACHWAEGGRADEIPPTLAEFIHRRVELLSSMGLRALQLVGLSRTLIPIGFIQEALELSLADFADLLDELSRHGVALSTSAQIECHDFVVKAAVARMTKASERLLRHRLSECWLKRADAEDSLDARVEAVEQLIAAEDCSRVVPLLIELGAALLRCGGAYRALSLLNEASQLVGGHADAHKLECLRRQALFRVGSYGQLLRLADAKLVHATAGNEWDIENPAEALQLLHLTNYEDAAPPQDVIARTIMMAECVRLEPFYRLEAARLAIEAAGDVPRPDLAQRAYTSVSTVEIDSPQLELARLRIDMYYHTPFGSAETARLAALQILRRIDEFENPELRTFLKHHIALCLRISGEYQHAFDLFQEVVVESSALGMGNARRKALCRLVLMNEEMGGDPSLSWAWIEQAGSWEHCDERAARSQYLLTRARLLAGRGNVAEARTIYDDVMSANTYSNEPKPLSYCHAVLLLLLRQQNSLAELEKQLPIALAVHKQAKDAGGQDYVVTQLLYSMSILGANQVELETTVSSYLKVRLENLPIGSYLRRAIKDLLGTSSSIAALAQRYKTYPPLS